MRKLISALKKITAMAFTRDNRVTKARQRLEGALGEYAKQKYAEVSGMPQIHNWESEIAALIGKVEELFDVKKAKLKTNFDREKAFKEAFNEASGAQEQVVSAKNEFLSYLNQKQRVAFLKKVKKPLDSNNLLHEMLIKFSPALVKKLE